MATEAVTFGSEIGSQVETEIGEGGDVGDGPGWRRDEAAWVGKTREVM